MGGVAPGSIDTAKWDNTVAAANITVLGVDTSWAEIQIVSPGGLVTINAGNTLTLGGNAPAIDMSAATQDLTLNCALALGAANIWDVATTRILTLGGAVSGSFNVTKQGAGTAILSAANSYTGINAINGGTLTLSGSGTLGNTANNLTLSGGQLDLGASSQTAGAVSLTAAAASGDTIKNGSLTGTSYAASSTTGTAIISASLLANGAAGFAKSGAGSVTLSGNNTYTGATAINVGTLNIQNVNALGTTAGNTTVANGATLQLQGGFSFAAEPLSLASGSSATVILQNVSGDHIWNGTIGTSGSGATARIASDSGTLTLADTVTGNSASTQVVLQGDGNVLVSGKITGSSPVTAGATGTGTRTLSNTANDFTGKVTATGGKLSFTSIKNVGGGASALGAPADATAGTIAVGSLAIAGNLTYTGSGDNSDRVLNLLGTIGGATIDQSGASGLLKFTSALTATGAGSKTLTLQGSTAGTGEIGGAIVDNSGVNTTALTKTGSGTWTLSGVNT